MGVKLLVFSVPYLRGIIWSCHRITSVFSEMGIAGSTLFQKILLVAMTTMGAGKLNSLAILLGSVWFDFKYLKYKC